MDLRSSLASRLYSDKFTSSWFSSSLDPKYYFEFFGLGLNGTLLVSSSVLSNDNDDFYLSSEETIEFEATLNGPESSES